MEGGRAMGAAAMVGKASAPPAARAVEPVVTIRGLAKAYARQQAVRGVDLDVRSGELYGLIGPDGAGKSSLMKAVAGVTTFDAGSIDVFGIRIDSEKAAERIKDRIGFMPQGLGQNLYPELSVDENIDFFAHSRLVPQKDINERKQHLLDMTRLTPFRHRPMKNLSGGMKQKLGLICTLIHEPRLVILDEPTTGVDPVSRRDFWAILSLLLRQRNITALVSTAYMDEASRFNRLSLFFDGRIVARGAPDEIVAAVPGTLVALKTERQAEALGGLRGLFHEVEARGSWLRVFVHGAGEEDAVSRLREALDAMDVGAVVLRAGTPELEDVFIALLREKRLSKDDPLPTCLPSDCVAPHNHQNPMEPNLNDFVGNLAGFRRKPESSKVSAGLHRGFGQHEETSFSEKKDSLQEESGAAIEAENLVRDFGAFRAVDGVSFRVAGGEIFGLLGANGAGKTTVIKMLVGLVKPTGGTGYVAGRGMLHASRAIKERIGYMSQVFSLYGDLTVVENITLYAGIYGLGRKETSSRTEWIIEMAELAGHEDRQTRGLPVGVRQRLALGCALVHRPRILFLDEPTSGVDPMGRRRFWDILFRLSRYESVAILITTHYMNEAEHCDHLALMHAGKIVADASPGEMKRRLEAEAGQLLEVSTDRPPEALECLQKAGFEGVALHGRQIHLLAPDRQATEHRIRETLAENGVRLLAMAEQPLSMEDVFVYRVLALERRGER
jgi:ABC-type multidrug transport system ATPase subunit